MKKQKEILKFKFLIIVLAIFLSCKSSKIVTDNQTCNENLKFKKAYFKNVRNIDSLIYLEQNESFHKSLKFISTYSTVSFESMLNYARTYPGGIYEGDKKNWLKWYEDNKCNNIQFKDSIR